MLLTLSWSNHIHAVNQLGLHPRYYFGKQNNHLIQSVPFKYAENNLPLIILPCMCSWKAIWSIYARMRRYPHSHTNAIRLSPSVSSVETCPPLPRQVLQSAQWREAAPRVTGSFLLKRKKSYRWAHAVYEQKAAGPSKHHSPLTSPGLETLPAAGDFLCISKGLLRLFLSSLNKLSLSQLRSFLLLPFLCLQCQLCMPQPAHHSVPKPWGDILSLLHSGSAVKHKQYFCLNNIFK